MCEAKTDKVMETMLRMCEECQDNWSFEVKGRLLTCSDLHAAEAVVIKAVIVISVIQSQLILSMCLLVAVLTMKSLMYLM